MMKNKVLIAMVVIVMVAAVASPSIAQRGRGWGWQTEGRGRGDQGGSRGGDPQEMRGRPEQRQPAGPTETPDFLLMDLNLTAEQVLKINVLREALLKEIRPLQEKTLSKQEDLMKYRQERPDLEELIQALQKELMNLKEETKKKKAGYEQEVQKVLTPEQKNLLSDLRREGCSDRGMRPDPGLGSGDGPGGPGGGMEPGRPSGGKGSWNW